MGYFMTTNLQTKFQKGDLVYFARNTDGFLEGDIAEILTATVTSVIISFKGQFINQWFNNSDFEKVAPDLEKPKFQKGDVVQFKDNTYGSSKGLRAIVLQATETNLIIERKGKFINRWFDHDEFELAPKHVDLDKEPSIKEDLSEALSENGFVMKALAVSLVGLHRLDKWMSKQEKKSA